MKSSSFSTTSPQLTRRPIANSSHSFWNRSARAAYAPRNRTRTSATGWRVNAWVKKGILLGFRMGVNIDMSVGTLHVSR